MPGHGLQDDPRFVLADFRLESLEQFTVEFLQTLTGENRMNPQTMVDVVVFALLALLGMWLTRRIRAPRNRWLKVGLLALLVIAPRFGADIRLLD